MPLFNQQKFQSLIGINNKWNPIPTFIAQAEEFSMFQSLIGINNKWNKRNVSIQPRGVSAFQSLIGINNKWNMVFKNFCHQSKRGFNP
mgnify:CR=1 FL=1